MILVQNYGFFIKSTVFYVLNIVKGQKKVI